MPWSKVKAETVRGSRKGGERRGPRRAKERHTADPEDHRSVGRRWRFPNVQARHTRAVGASEQGALQRTMKPFILPTGNIRNFIKFLSKTLGLLGCVQDIKVNKKNLKQIQVSHEKKTLYFPLYWLVNRDPYIGVL